MTHSTEHRYKRLGRGGKGGGRRGKKKKEKKRLEIIIDWNHVSIYTHGQDSGLVCVIGLLFGDGYERRKRLQKNK